MRKCVTTITQETCEYGSISLENWLLATILGFANSEAITKDHIDTMVSRAVKRSEAGKGRTLTVEEDLVELAAGTPVAEEAATIAKSAV